MLRVLVLLLVVPVIGWAEEPVPGSVAEIAADFDPTAESLDTRVIRDWEEDGLRLRYVTFHVGAFKNRKARLAGFYAVPKPGRDLPGLLHLHGGGRRRPGWWRSLAIGDVAGVGVQNAGRQVDIGFVGPC